MMAEPEPAPLMLIRLLIVSGYVSTYLRAYGVMIHARTLEPSQAVSTVPQRAPTPPNGSPLSRTDAPSLGDGQHAAFRYGGYGGSEGTRVVGLAVAHSTKVLDAVGGH
jgi:hypothetical protein